MSNNHTDISKSNIKMDENSQKILDHSSKRFFKEGFNKITMDEIAADLQMSKKTIYKYFSSKNRLIEAIANKFTSNAASEVEAVIKSDENAVIKIMGMLKFFSRIANLVSERIIIDLQRKLPWIWERVDKFRTQMMNKNLSLIINQGKEEGLIKDYPTEIVITMIIAGVRSVVNPNFLMNNNYSLEAAFGTCFDIIFNGLLTDKGQEIYNNYKKDKE